MLEERHSVPLEDGKLALALHLPDGRGPVACVVACHGLGASKDSDKYLLLGEEFPRAGLALARFDFRGCGESTGREDETTVASRIDDCRAVLARLESHPRLDGRFGLLGSSMGGFVALHVAAARGDGTPVVTWNAPASLADLGDSRDSPGIGMPFLLELSSGRYADSPRGVPRHLVIQAEADDVVDLEHGSMLHARAAEPCDFVIIPGADHRLTDMAHRRAAVARSLDWLLRFVRETP
ncbi:MAG: alpha/beta fold hydrolase [Candidatus Rokubacteria bacterium]|nr:alpha/beta fold hydrolase [Candidatus Rokubacteria bacterium]